MWKDFFEKSRSLTLHVYQSNKKRLIFTWKTFKISYFLNQRAILTQFFMIRFALLFLKRWQIWNETKERFQKNVLTEIVAKGHYTLQIFFFGFLCFRIIFHCLPWLLEKNFAFLQFFTTKVSNVKWCKNPKTWKFVPKFA